jgi:molecular chaperone DnaK
MAEKIIGIDLGTTNSVVAVMEGTQVKVIPNKASDRPLVPSVVAFTDKGERLVGEPAKRQAITNPLRTIYSIKRFMGRRHYEVESEEKLVPYKIVGGPQDLVKVEVDGKQYTPPEISALVLRNLKESAEAYLGQTVKKAVITVPAYFNDAQRQATIDAAAIAGFETEWEIEDPKTGKKNKQRMRIINEPTAAALAYHLDKKKDERIAVFDLGGGTFDISILDVGEDGVFQVKSTNGDTHLGGDDFDQVVIDWIAEEFKKREGGFDLRKDPMALQRLKEAAEQAKKDLSKVSETSIKLPFITAIQGVPKHVDLNLTRSKFEQMVDHLVERCRGPVNQALRDAGYKPGDIHEIVMVGGMTRMPKIQELVKQVFGKEGHRGVNPDEVVAVGAAIQGAQLMLGSQSKLLLLDVTPLTLGIETLHGRMTPLIQRNTAIPTKKSEIFTTAADNQTSVEVKVYQGERPMAGDNKLIGQFFLDGIPPAPRHTPQIEVTFDIDANGILNVTARDKGTGKENKIRLENSSGMSQEEIDRMKRDAEVHADDDKRKKELVDARNKADGLIFTIEKTFKDAGDKISESDKAPIRSAIDNLRQKMNGEDTAAIEQAISQLEQASHAMAEHLYRQSGGGGPAAGEPTGGPSPDGTADGTADGDGKGKGDDVIDADYEVKK